MFFIENYFQKPPVFNVFKSIRVYLRTRSTRDLQTPPKSRYPASIRSKPEICLQFYVFWRADRAPSISEGLKFRCRLLSKSRNLQ